MMDPESETPAAHYFRVESQDGVTIVTFEDVQIGPDARDPLYGLVENDGHTNVVLDLSAIWALSSLALGILANFQQRVESRGGRLVLCGLNSNLKQVFRMTKLDQIFTISETRQDALQQFVRTPTQSQGPGNRR
jgi:anti-anti-sigma factor